MEAILHLIFSRVHGTLRLPCALNWVGPTSRGDGGQFQVAKTTLNYHLTIDRFLIFGMLDLLALPYTRTHLEKHIQWLLEQVLQTCPLCIHNMKSPNLQ